MLVNKIVGCCLVLLSCHAAGQAVSSAYAVSDKNLEFQESQTQLLWGDTHVHTVLSGDSALFGNKLVGPDEAYRFAKGEVVQASLGKPAQLETPLDFLLVSDHAETMSTIWQLRHPTAKQKREQRLQAALNIVERGLEAIPADVSQIETVNVALSSAAMFLLDGSAASNRAANNAWQEIVASAERHNQPGEFTALIGYEWSSTPNGDNLHRVVMYRDGADGFHKLIQSVS